VDVVLGYDNLEGYLEDKCYFGCIVGRVANIIASGKFKLNGTEYFLTQNDGKNSLHGGTLGFHQAVFQVINYSSSADSAKLELSYFSRDGESGYPGNLSVKATYILTKDNSIKLQFSATTNQDTIVNLTNHSYFNLTGASRDILDHVVTINANKFVPVDADLIPTGELESVSNTPMDFLTPTKIGARIHDNFAQ